MHPNNVMEVVRPDCITSVATLLPREDQFSLVSRVLADDESAQGLDFFSDFLNQVGRRCVRDGLRRIETKAVDVIFLHPVGRVL
jgi:hypothetical protein